MTNDIASYQTRISRFQRLIERLLEIESNDPALSKKFDLIKADALDAISHRKLPRAGFPEEARARGRETRKKQARALRAALKPFLTEIRLKHGACATYKKIADELNKAGNCPMPVRSLKWTDSSIRAVLTRKI